MNKLIKSALVTGALILGVTPLSFAKFTDLIDIGNYTKAIESLVEKGVINGYPDNTFKPEGKITRAEFVKMIVANEKLSQTENEKINFQDVGEHWAKEYIDLASMNKVIKGYEDNTFKPDKEITYAEVISVLLNTLGVNELDSDLAWGDACMKKAGELGLLDGIATNDLISINSARRDNVALMVWNKENINISGDNIESEDNNIADKENSVDNDNQEDSKNNTTEKINTRELHLGVVKKHIIKNEKDYITVQDINGEEEEFELYSKSAEPKLDSFIIFTLTSKGKMKLTKQLLLEDIKDATYLVEAIDEKLIKLKDEKYLLDLSIDEFRLAGKEEIDLDEYTYYVIQMKKDDNGVYKFKTIEEVKREDLSIEEDDRICFDSQVEISLIIKGLEI